jgi:hypothetical protein
MQGVTGIFYQIPADIPADMTLSQYVMTAEYILHDSNEHGLIETDPAWFVVSYKNDSKLPKEVVVEASEKFQEVVNNYHRRQHHGD